MKNLLVIISVIMLTACHRQHVGPGCDTTATVTDLGSGCGLGFKLSDGTLLSADQHTSKCSHNNPLQNFTLVEGMRVQIGYEKGNHGSPCGGAASVSVSCIQAISEKTE